MSALPPALATWGPELEGLALDLVEDLQPWLLRVSAAIGPLKSHRQSGQGAPDGFDGLTRKGPYGRLLTTEWLLAEHYPDEFLRRASQAEHLFYDLATEVPAGHRSCAALFDAGPEQWGAPRILQLALLITLARRARLAKVEFKWGIAQDSRAALIDGLSPQSALKLLQGRDYALPETAHLQQWREHLRGLDIPVDETWWVGGASLSALAPTGDRVAETVEPLTLAGAQVLLRLGAPHAQELTLQLPAMQRRVRLLRNPFEVQDTSPHLFEGAGVTDLLFSVDGRTLFAWGKEGLHAHAVPQPGAAQVPPMQLADPDQLPVAVGRSGKRLVVIIEQEPDLDIVTFSKRGHECEASMVYVDAEVRAGAEAQRSARLSPCVVVGSTQNQQLLVLDAQGQALRICQTQGTARLLSRGVTGLSRAMGGAALVIARHLQGGATANPDSPLALSYGGRTMTQADLPARAIVICEADRARRVVHLPSGSGDYRSLFSQTTVAVRIEPDEWFLQTRDSECMVKVPEGHRILGPGWTPTPGLVTLAPDEFNVHLCLEREVRALARSPVKLTEATLSPRAPIVAYRTLRGGFCVDELTSGRTLMVRAPRGA